MIKLVATDIDGTLLPNGSLRINKSVIQLIKELKNLGVIFVAASGRQLPSLKMLFEEVKDDILFIAENGALVSYKDEILYEKTMSSTLANEIVSDILRNEPLIPIVSTKDTVYINTATYKYFKNREKEILYTMTITENFKEIKDKVLKVTACALDGIRPYAKYLANNWKRFCEVSVSGFMYCDFMNISVSKGNALKFVLSKFAINTDEVVCFGDNYNDISMLSLIHNSFAMTGADDKVKENARYQTDNVEKTIRKIYNID